MMRRSVLGLGLFVGTAGAASATTVTLLDGAGDVGRYAKLAIGADGLGLITYYDNTNRDLKVAHCSNVACTAATISVLDTGDVRNAGALAIGADGRGIVGYLEGTSIKTAHCDDLLCTSATIRVIEQNVSDSVGLTIGADSLPLLAYQVPNELHTAHCTVPDCSTVTVASVGPSTATQDIAMTIGTDGLGIIVALRVHGGLPDVRRCLDVPCTATTPAAPPGSGPLVFVLPGAVVVPADGRPLIGYRHSDIAANPQYEVRLTRCADAACSAQVLGPAFPYKTDLDVQLRSDGLAWFAYLGTGEHAVRRCDDLSCESSTASCFAAGAVAYISLAQGTDGRSLAAFFDFDGLGVAHDVSGPCAEREIRVADVTFSESPGGPSAFTVTLSAPSTFQVWLTYDTVSGTALAGLDYVPTTGTLTFPAGTTTVQVPVSIVDDALHEEDETFSLRLSNAFNAVIADVRGVATILDNDPLLTLAAGDCQHTEGGANAPCTFSIRLEGTGTQAVTVGYATADGTATAGVDYEAATGTLTFPPGTPSRTIPVTVLGDTKIELHETFTVNLSNPVGGAIVDGTGEGTILDDDAPALSSLELTHGSRLTADLAAVPGPLADEDLYRLAQPGPSSWEIVVDEVSGDIAPGLALDRLAEDNSTVLQTGAPVGLGPARALRWQRRVPFGEMRQHIRVRSTSCTTGCGPDDTYRLRVHETTARIPRFNNTGSQATVVVLQNPTGQPVGANVDFWDAGGALLATAPLALPAHGVGLFATPSSPALAGSSGSITITHDGPYGALAGKAVALEPATGFSFDSPLSYKPR